MERIVNRRHFIYSAFLVTIITTQGLAADANNNEIELNGLVIDRTITLKGHQFYQEFSRAWSPSSKLGGFNITIIEKPSARWGSRLTVESQGRILYATTLQRNGDEIKRQASIATDVTYKKIFSLHLLNKLGSEDMSNNGY